MSSLHIVRHGQASLFADDYDQLSDLGYEQSRKLGEFWVSRGQVADAVFCGTLSRQRQTADAFCSVLNADGHAVTAPESLPGLNEYPAEEIMRLLLPQLSAADEKIREIACRYEQADDYRTRYRSLHQLLAVAMRAWIAGDYSVDEPLLAWGDFRDGVRAALADIMRRSGSGKAVAVFTSGGPIGVSVQSALRSPDPVAAEINWRVYNASVTRYSWSGERITLDAFNDTGHLPASMLTYR